MPGIFEKVENITTEVLTLLRVIYISLCNSSKPLFFSFTARERIVGWYSHTGPKLHKNDIAINELMKRYCPNSVSALYLLKPLTDNCLPVNSRKEPLVDSESFHHFFSINLC